MVWKPTRQVLKGRPRPTKVLSCSPRTVTTRIVHQRDRLRRGGISAQSKPPPTRCAGANPGKSRKGKNFFFQLLHRPAFRPASTRQTPGRTGKAPHRKGRPTDFARGRESASSWSPKAKANQGQTAEELGISLKDRGEEEAPRTSHGEARTSTTPPASTRYAISTGINREQRPSLTTCCLAAGNAVRPSKIKTGRSDDLLPAVLFPSPPRTEGERGRGEVRLFECWLALKPAFF